MLGTGGEDMCCEEIIHKTFSKDFDIYVEKVWIWCGEHDKEESERLLGVPSRTWLDVVFMVKIHTIGKKQVRNENGKFKRKRIRQSG